MRSAIPLASIRVWLTNKVRLLDIRSSYDRLQISVEDATDTGRYKYATPSAASTRRRRHPRPSSRTQCRSRGRNLGYPHRSQGGTSVQPAEEHTGGSVITSGNEYTNTAGNLLEKITAAALYTPLCPIAI